MKMYEVGGCVRDEILGTPAKDIDFTVVLEGKELSTVTDSTYFEEMEEVLKRNGFRLIEEARKPEFFTARGFFPDDHVKYPGKPADFVLARKDGEYTDGRRPDDVGLGTLLDDLARRDFTMNAIAKDGDTLIDPFGGYSDIEKKLIRAVGNPLDRLNEDALRAVRALRFAVTKGFFIDQQLAMAMQNGSVLSQFTNKIISEERVQQELSKMFRYDSVRSMKLLVKFRHLTNALFDGNVSLDATLKTRGRG